MATKGRTASYDKLIPDTRYGSLLASKFINCLMHDGKKSVAPVCSTTRSTRSRNACLTRIRSPCSRTR